MLLTLSQLHGVFVTPVSGCQQSLRQIDGIVADLNSDDLDSFCHAVHLLREGMKKHLPEQVLFMYCVI